MFHRDLKILCAGGLGSYCWGAQININELSPQIASNMATFEFNHALATPGHLSNPFSYPP
jgi:hypothetical protein